MNYSEILTRALAISWRHRYLWLLALFAGEASTSSLPGFGGGNSGWRTTSVQPGAVTWNDAMAWISAHASLLWAAGISLAVVAVLLFLLSAVANGALVRAAAQHDDDKPFNLGQAWSAGLETFWPVLGLKLFTLVVGVALLVVIGGIGLMAAVLGLSGSVGASVAAGAVAGLLLLAAIPFLVVFEVAVRLGVRAVVLDGRSTSDGLREGFSLIRRRFGRVALVWLLVWVAGLVATTAAGLVAVVGMLPLAGLTAGVYFAAGWPWAVLIGAVLGAAWLALVLALAGGVSSFTSTSWTLAYRRFDVEAARAPSAHPQPA